jgi:GTPase Era involved in 16S rRNA processing
MGNKVRDEFHKLEQAHTSLTINNRLIEQNILLLGPTQSGKTTLTQVLENPCHRPDHLALRGTPNQTAKLKRIECGVSTHLKLNIVEIPGEMLENERDLSQIDEDCVRMGITQFHLVCFCVSVENGIFKEDTRLFERLINHFGAAKIQSNLSLILTRCESKDNTWRESIKNEINKDSRFSRLIQRFGRGTHFTGALNPTDWDRANEEVILDQFQTIYHDRQAFLQFIERECNTKPFIIQERKIGSSHENLSK